MNSRQSAFGRFCTFFAACILALALVGSPALAAQGGGSYGTGFLINSDGYMLTCWHVVDNAERIIVVLGGRRYEANVVALDEKRDLALLRIPVKNVPALPLGDSKSLEKGEEVRAFGFPLAESIDEKVKVTRGTVANITTREDTPLFEIDVVINPGNSGGPLVNERGEVIGINVQKRVQRSVRTNEIITNLAVAVPGNEAKSLLRRKAVNFSDGGASEKLDGPGLVKRVAPSVGLVLVLQRPAQRVSKSEIRNPKSEFVTHRPPDSSELMWTLTGHTHEVRSIAFAPDGATLALASSDGSIQLLDAVTRQVRWARKGHRERVNALKFSPDGQTLASAGDDREIRLWDTGTGDVHRTLTGHGAWVSSLAFSPDGNMLASGSYREIRLWDTETGRLQRTLDEVRGLIYGLAFSRDGRTLAGGGSDHSIRIWDTRTGVMRRTLTGHNDEVVAVAFSPDGKTFASGSRDHVVKLWSTATGKEKRTIHGSYGSLGALVFTPDGKALATGSGDKTVRLWNPQTGRVERAFIGHDAAVEALAFSPDGTLLASGGADKTAKLWRVK